MPRKGSAPQGDSVQVGAQKGGLGAGCGRRLRREGDSARVGAQKGGLGAAAENERGTRRTGRANKADSAQQRPHQKAKPMNFS